MVCRGFTHNLEDGGEREFEPVYPDETYEVVLTKKLVSPMSGNCWTFLTRQMRDWQKERQSSYGHRAETQPYTSAPSALCGSSGWTPAPDDSLAAAMLRSLAYGEGPERLDEKLIAATNNLIRCLRT